MDYTRREFGKLALASLPAAALIDTPFVGAVLSQAKPNSLINGVQIGTITYSFGGMPDQSVEGLLKYTVEGGISAVELMGQPVEAYARARTGFTGGGGGRRGGGGGGGRGAGAPGAPADAAAGAAAGGRAAGRGGGGGGNEPIPADAMWKGQACSAFGRGGGGGGGRGRAAADAAAGAAAGAAAAAPPAPTLTPEQQAAADAKAREETLKWRREMSMDIFKDLRKMYNDAGVSIYAVKNINANQTDEELEWVFAVAQTLGASHVTMELPGAGPNAAATFKRLGDWALRKKIFVAYHTHAQGGMEVFDEAFAQSNGNMANVDFGHFVAGGNKGGTPLDFLNKFHDRIASFHLKDRTLPEHCSLNLPWGEGETPIKEILQTVQKNKWKMPATIELEYPVPPGSDKVKELQKCLAYCRAALA